MCAWLLSGARTALTVGSVFSQGLLECELGIKVMILRHKGTIEAPGILVLLSHP